MIHRFFSQAWLYHKGRTEAFHLADFLASEVGYPAVTMIFYCLLAAYGFQTMDLTHWVISNAFLLCTNSCIFNLGTIFLGERYSGRLRSIVVAPCSTLSLVLASGIGPILTASVTVAFNMLRRRRLLALGHFGQPDLWCEFFRSALRCHYPDHPVRHDLCHLLWFTDLRLWHDLLQHPSDA